MRHITSAHYSQLCSAKDSVGWLPVDHHLRNARSRSSNSSTCCYNTRCCCNTRCCNTLYISRKDNISTSSDIWRRPPTLQQQQSSSPVRHDTHEGERRCNFRSEDVPCLGLLHEVAPAVPSAGRTRARTSCYLGRRDGKECRLYTHNGTKALIRNLHKASYYIIIHPRLLARNALCERTCFWRMTTQPHPKRSWL